ncbi:WD repeat-containing protein 8 [Dacryopinax primogenitus]|uniref:WD repeat-containing protein 8 n=1 Tax=Dacryopinax primogenitus (strain DJM 731) TaxID=1858805 RepID=M5FWJ7_DACPD|nr:WD repeat-containing protein 8 [Dacryopinax primogenitus]EJT97786.1 WD repeat-containing protein 8 [Dacryopinax primogenitus]
MDFTDLYKHASQLCAFSPSGSHILTATYDRLIIRLASTLQIMRTWEIDPAPSPSSQILKAKPTPSGRNNAPSSNGTKSGGITAIGWSEDEEYVLACLAGRGVVEVRSAREGEGEETWEAGIEAGAEGLVRAEFALDARNILCWSEWGLRLTIHSLISGQSTVIPQPTYPDRAYAFSLDAGWLVLATRKGGKDFLNVHDPLERFALVRQSPLPTTSLVDFSLSPDGLYVACWESLLDFKLHILALDGRLQATFTPPGPFAETGLGVRCVSWHPNSGFVAVGGWDDKLHILAKLADWRAVATLEMSVKLGADSGINAWREPSGWLEATMHRGFVQYSPAFLPLSLPSVRPDPSRVPLRSGASYLSFSPCGRYLLARSDTTPNAAHIFSFPPPSLPFFPQLHTVLLHERKVFTALWKPGQAGGYKLALGCEGKGAVYLWSDENEWEGDEDSDVRQGMADCCSVPARKFELKELAWSPDGNGLLLFDKDTFCCAFEVPADQQEQADQ